jgi:NADH:ubiquinone oxidoreductase subunit F (NADH-binding)
VRATEGFIYIRGEYEIQAQLLEHAIRQAEERHYLGENILDTDFSFHLHVHRGAGAYICGEETALLESLEGKRGEPRIRPPFPAQSGFHGLPTVVNNVETFASVPHIVLNGADWYTSLSASTTPGTKMFCLTGHINNPGVFEAPYGLTLRQLIDQFGGGMCPGSEFRMALCGGAAGTIIPQSLLDVPLDYESIKKGVSIGAGAFLICDQTVSPVALLRELMWFFEHESCGKCTPCRVGTHQTRVLLDRMLAGDRRAEDVAELRALGEVMGNASFCGLGISTWLPISSVLEHFESDFR